MPANADIVGLGGVYVHPSETGGASRSFASPDEGGSGKTNNGGYISSLDIGGSGGFDNLSANQDADIEGQVLGGSLVPSNSTPGSYEPSSDFVYIGRWRAPAFKDNDTLGNPTGPATLQFVVGKPAGDTDLLGKSTQAQPWLEYTLASSGSNSYVTAQRPGIGVPLDHDAGYFDSARLLLDPYTASVQFYAKLAMNPYGGQYEQTFYTLQRNAPLSVNSNRVDVSYSALCTPHCINNVGEFSAMAFLDYAGIALNFHDANLGYVYGTAALGRTPGGSLAYDHQVLPQTVGGLHYLMAPLNSGSDTGAFSTTYETSGHTITTLNDAAIMSISPLSAGSLDYSMSQPMDSDGNIASTAIAYTGSITNESGSALANNDFAYLGTWSVPTAPSADHAVANASIFVLGVASPWSAVASKGAEQGNTLRYEYSNLGNGGSTVMAVRPDNSVDQFAGNLNSAKINVNTTLAQATVTASMDLNAYGNANSKVFDISSSPIGLNTDPSSRAVFSGNITATDNTDINSPVQLPGTASGMIMNVTANSNGQAGLVMRFQDPDMGQIGAGALLSYTPP